MVAILIIPKYFIHVHAKLLFNDLIRYYKKTENNFINKIICNKNNKYYIERLYTNIFDVLCN